MSNSTTRPTASDIASKFQDNISGKTILITGCSPNSLGYECARSIAPFNPALIILSGRSREKIEETEKAIKEETPSVKTRILIFDLASQASVRAAAKEVNDYPETVDILINNAGIMVPPKEINADGIESQFAVNHIGHFLLTNLLMDKMLAKGGRVITVTSGAYQLGGIRWEDLNFEKEEYKQWQAYAQSKTANILFAASLADKLGNRGIVSFSASPGGGVYTSLGRHMKQEDFEFLSNMPIPILSLGEGTASIVAGAVDPTLDSHNGSLLDNCEATDETKNFPYATGTENANKLWALSEEMVGQKFSYN